MKYHMQVTWDGKKCWPLTADRPLGPRRFPLKMRIRHRPNLSSYSDSCNSKSRLCRRHTDRMHFVERCSSLFVTLHFFYLLRFGFGDILMSAVEAPVPLVASQL